MKRTGYIYIIESQEGYKYVGQTVTKTKRRGYHLGELSRGNHPNKKLQNYYNKHGKNSLKFYILMECPENELDFWEKWWIKSFNSFPTKNGGFNMTTGGKGNGQCISIKKPCYFQNAYTDETVYFPSRQEFANYINVSQNCLTDVLSGKVKTIYGWYDLNKEWRPKIYNLISPDGKPYQLKEFLIGEFCKKYGFISWHFRRLLNRKLESYHGWTRPDSKSKIKSLNPRPKIKRKYVNGQCYT